MIAFLGIFLVSLVAVISLAAAVNYFLRIGIWPSLGFAVVVVAVFLIFALSGMWADAQQHDWGGLTPIFALMLLSGFCCIKFGKKAWAWWQRKLRELLG